MNSWAIESLTFCTRSVSNNRVKKIKKTCLFRILAQCSEVDHRWNDWIKTKDGGINNSNRRTNSDIMRKVSCWECWLVKAFTILLLIVHEISDDGADDDSQDDENHDEESTPAGRLARWFVTFNVIYKSMECLILIRAKKSLAAIFHFSDYR